MLLCCARIPPAPPLRADAADQGVASPTSLPPLASVICLTGSEGAGKSCLLYSAAVMASSPNSCSWLTHRTRREMMLPALRQRVTCLARMLVGTAIQFHMLAMEEHTQAVQMAVQSLIRPADAHLVDPLVCVLLHELDVFENVLNRMQQQQQQQLALALHLCRPVLCKENFPGLWFMPPLRGGAFDDDDAATATVPSHAQVLRCMPASIALTEIDYLVAAAAADPTARVRLLDSPFPVQRLAPSVDDMFASYPTRTTKITAAYVFGLLVLPHRLEEECQLARIRYLRACHSTRYNRYVDSFALVFSQVDAWMPPRGGGVAVAWGSQDWFDALKRLVITPVLQCIASGVSGVLFPIRISLVNCLHPGSALACVKELGGPRTRDRPFREEFVPQQGVAAHVERDDKSLGGGGGGVEWCRSLLGGGGSSAQARLPFALLDDCAKRVVLTVHLCSRRPECTVLFPLPAVLLALVLDFVI